MSQETVLLVDIPKNKRGDVIRVSTIPPKKSEEKTAVDIRQMYQTDAEELGYTQKGVRFDAALTYSVVEALVQVLSPEEKAKLKAALKD